MKTIEWQKFLRDQASEHGKQVFTVAELANTARTTLPVLNVELDRLVKRGVLTRLARGRYSSTTEIQPAALVHALDSQAYITGFAALAAHQMVFQQPAEFSCFTSRRHNRSRIRQTAVGRLVFICVSQPVYSPPDEGSAIAPPEQALCDFFYLAGRESLDPASLVQFRNLNRLDTATLEDLLPRYPQTVARSVRALLKRSLDDQRLCPIAKG